MQVDNQVYFEITNNSSVSQLSILLIIVGLFIMIVGGIGSVGAIFASTLFGRITLGLVSCMCVENYVKLAFRDDVCDYNISKQWYHAAIKIPPTPPPHPPHTHAYSDRNIIPHPGQTGDIINYLYRPV